MNWWRYYVPRKELKGDWKITTEYPEGFCICEVSTGDDSGPKTVDNVLFLLRDPLKNLIRFPFDKMGAWFEEDEQIYVHPKDPYKRIDIRRSSRHIKVEVDGIVVAETNQPALLFETMLRTRYYLPASCIVHKLSNSDTVTSCPYKGDASYFNVVVNGKEIKDVAWRYKFPTQESAPIAGLLCFYSEKVDIWVDGVKESQSTDEETKPRQESHGRSLISI